MLSGVLWKWILNAKWGSGFLIFHDVFWFVVWSWNLLLNVGRVGMGCGCNHVAIAHAQSLFWDKGSAPLVLLVVCIEILNMFFLIKTLSYIFGYWLEFILELWFFFFFKIFFSSLWLMFFKIVLCRSKSVSFKNENTNFHPRKSLKSNLESWFTLKLT